ncbi:MAG: ABC transporter permease [Tissierellia bacterium]|jgi:peptide/nickel transport system permease protein|nr:ABC transporter permease [Bacillota bacterium]NLK58470.1 ABC transporter permease [Tissierellia bacterium]
MIKYILKRLLHMIPVLLIISMVIFGITKLAPGDSVGMGLDPRATAESLERQREALGLNDPVPVQYIKWLTRVVQGDFGRSSQYMQPIMNVVPERLWNSFILNVVVYIIAFMLSIPIGIVSAVKQYSTFDSFWTVFSIIGISMPSFFFGLLLIYVFSAKLQWLPFSGKQTPGLNATGWVAFKDLLKHMVLPATVLILGSLASTVRYTRTSMLEVIKQDYVRTARSKGLNERVVVYKHAFRNALIPIITLVGAYIPALFSGAAILERTFIWPGIGNMLVTAVFARDYNLVIGLNVFFAFLTLMGNLLADVGYALVDPRVKVD